MNTRIGSSTERGFSLIETLVAMAILSIVLMTLAGLTGVVASRSITSSVISHRDAVLTVEAGKLSVLPFDSLQSRAGCNTVSTDPFPHQSCTVVTVVSANVQQVQVVVAPTNTAYSSDTLVFDRTRF